MYALIHVTSRKVADKCGVSRQAVAKWEKDINFIILSLDRLF
ncbi:helix-turn-helix domain-containing protein [Coprococcus sp. RTP31081st1_D2_RTP31081_211007]